MWPFNYCPKCGNRMFIVCGVCLATTTVALGAYQAAKEKRQRAQKENKMKLEAGKWYEVEGRGIFECTVAPISKNVADPSQRIYILGGHIYTQDGEGALTTRGRVIREVPPPLKLEVGALYEMSNGKVERCEVTTNGCDFPFRLGVHYYTERGDTLSLNASRPLYKLRVNEPVSGGGEKFQERVKEAQGMMESITPSVARVLRPMLDEIIARSEARQPLKVQYDPYYCARREIVIPDGYRQVLDPDSVMLGYLTNTPEGFWKPVNGVHAAFSGMDAIDDACGRTYIRPIAKPFKVDGKGWYLTRDRGWIKNPPTAAAPGHKWRPWWYENGQYLKGEECDFDIISKATPAQAAALDAL